MPAVFLDRDGTISAEVGYLDDPARLELIPGSAEAIRACNGSGLLVVVVTNQSGVARGYFTEETVRATHARLTELLAAQGARVDGFYFCPHHPGKGEPPYRLECECRKPRPGMINAACRDLPIDPARSYMVGDKWSDYEFGSRNGLHSVLVLTGYGRAEYELNRGVRGMPDHVATDLRAAANWILEDLNRSEKEN